MSELHGVGLVTFRSKKTTRLFGVLVHRGDVVHLRPHVARRLYRRNILEHVLARSPARPWDATYQPQEHYFEEAI